MIEICAKCEENVHTANSPPNTQKRLKKFIVSKHMGLQAGERPKVLQKRLFLRQKCSYNEQIHENGRRGAEGSTAADTAEVCIKIKKVSKKHPHRLFRCKKGADTALDKPRFAVVKCTSTFMGILHSLAEIERNSRFSCANCPRGTSAALRSAAVPKFFVLCACVRV